MKIENLKWTWVIYPEENLVNGCELKCPECKEWVNHNQWKDSCVYCESCGDHTAIQCPNCEEIFDHVLDLTFQCRKPI